MPADRPIHGRAETPEQKRAIIEKLLQIWLMQPHSRLGQLIVNKAPGLHPNAPLYYVEDEDLVALMEAGTIYENVPLDPLLQVVERRPRR
jgi:hypothetical protein